MSSVRNYSYRLLGGRQVGVVGLRLVVGEGQLRWLILLLERREQLAVGLLGRRRSIVGNIVRSCDFLAMEQ